MGVLGSSPAGLLDRNIVSMGRRGRLQSEWRKGDTPFSVPSTVFGLKLEACSIVIFRKVDLERAFSALVR